MIREERPGIDGVGPRRRERGQARHEIAAIGDVAEQGPTLDAAHHDVGEDPGRRFRTKCGRASRRGYRGMGQAAHILLYLPTSRIQKVGGAGLGGHSGFQLRRVDKVACHVHFDRRWTGSGDRIPIDLPIEHLTGGDVELHLFAAEPLVEAASI